MHVPDLCFDSQSIHFKEGSNKHIASHQTRKRSRPTSPFIPPVRLFCFRVFESEVKVLFTQSCPLFVTPWTVAFQAPLSTGFSRKEYWSGARSRHTRSHPWQGHEGENLTGKADQVFRDSEKLPPALTLKMVSVFLMLASIDYSLISVTQAEGLPQSLSK